jgi:hypothetical protein
VDLLLDMFFLEYKVVSVVIAQAGANVAIIAVD